MWFNLNPKEVEKITHALSSSIGDGPAVEGGAALAQRMTEEAADMMKPEHQVWVEAAVDLHQDEGSVEVDRQGDDSAFVSYSDDGGAYVMAWVWVPEKLDADEEEEDGE